jgi:DNA-binding SARP family transcriptional activator
MDFRILGPLEAFDKGRDLPPAGSKRRALLALLLLNANKTLTVDRLVDELWGEPNARWREPRDGRRDAFASRGRRGRGS